MNYGIEYCETLRPQILAEKHSGCWHPNSLTDDDWKEVTKAYQFFTNNEYFSDKIHVFTDSNRELKGHYVKILKYSDIQRWREYARPESIGCIVFDPTEYSLQGMFMLSPKRLAFLGRLDIGAVITNPYITNSRELLNEVCESNNVKWMGDSAMPIIYRNYRKYQHSNVNEFFTVLKGIIDKIPLMQLIPTTDV